jgi:nicotinate-nucleotide pyrophosphorylase (carboxylating)
MTAIDKQIEEIINRALSEDLGGGDITTDALVDPKIMGKADFLVKTEGVLAGIGVAGKVFKTVDPSVEMKVLIGDGSRIRPGDIVAAVSGPLASILKAERTSLNFLQRMSGIATAAAQYVAAVGGTGVKILDTRKTAPGLRLLDKYAVKAGGGQNHRLNLSDGILIKDNHLEAAYKQGLTLAETVEKARRNAPARLKVEVETKTLDEVKEAISAKADIIMLDNMSPDLMREAVKIIAHKALVEASGNVNLNTVRAIAETGVDFISVGALTHSVKALDISLEFTKL